jgi:hypothetical protein
MTFTKKQIAEILDAIDMRRDVITGDADSATEFETVENLNALEAKIKTGSNSFTADESKWLMEEIGDKIEIALAAIEDRELKMKALADLNSLTNAMSKL